jgi:hypothetical protein
MKTKIFAALLFCVAFVPSVYSQKVKDLDAIKSEIRAARSEAIREKTEILRGGNLRMAVPADFYDTESFGKNAKFLGSLYAGTIYVYYSCDPTTLETEIGVVLAPDDKCIAYTPNTPPGPTTDYFDPAWEITIPGKTVENVIYPMLNNNPGFDAADTGTGSFASLFYTPRLTIESDALNDPAAINPNTGLPMNGSFTTSLAGSKTKSFSLEAGEFESEYTGYASVGGRGLSRSYFAALGLPNNVINKLFKKDMKLKFGIRMRVSGQIDYAQFYYTYRLLGN